MKKQIINLTYRKKLYLEKSIEHIKNKMSETCDGCLWEGVCDGVLPCSDYDPADDGNYIDEYIETRRIEFDQDWQQYIEEGE